MCINASKDDETPEYYMVKSNTDCPRPSNSKYITKSIANFYFSVEGTSDIGTILFEVEDTNLPNTHLIGLDSITMEDLFQMKLSGKVDKYMETMITLNNKIKSIKKEID